MRRHVVSVTSSLVAALGCAAALSQPALGKSKDTAKEQVKAVDQLKKITAKVEAAKQAGKGKLRDEDCRSFAKDYVGFSKDWKVAEGYFNSGVLLGECGLLADAETAYKNALDQNPNHAGSMVNLGELYYRQGKFGEASTQFDRANKTDPKNAQAYTGGALVLFDRARQSGNDPATLKEAVGKLRRALALDSDSPAAYNLLALIYYVGSESNPAQLDLAKLVCDQAILVNDRYPPIYNTLGLIKLRKKNVTGALGEFRKAVEQDPKYIEAQLNIGAITLSARDYKNAEAAFKAVIDAKPTDAKQKFDATMGLGVALRGQRRVDEAEQWYAKAKEIDKQNCAVPYNLGILNQDYKAGAEADLNKAKTYFNDFLSCGRADAEKIKDGQRRVKEIDDTFKALAEAKVIEAEAKKMQEEADRQQKEYEKQQKLEEEKQKLEQQKAPAPGAKPGDKPADKPGDAKPGDAAKPADGAKPGEAAKPADGAKPAAKPGDKPADPKAK